MNETTTTIEAGRRGGLAAAKRMTPSERKARARAGHLASSVTAIERRVRELTPEQLDRMVTAVTGELARREA